MKTYDFVAQTAQAILVAWAGREDGRSAVDRFTSDSKVAAEQAVRMAVALQVALKDDDLRSPK